MARQISVKATYSLWVTQAEHDAMVRVLGDCAGQLAPTNEQAAAAPILAGQPGYSRSLDRDGDGIACEK